MENNTNQNTGNTNDQKQKQDTTGANDQKQGKKDSVLQVFQPHDMSKTIESAMHVFQGRHEKLPDLMQDVGNIILKAAKRFTTTQLIIGAGAVTVGAILLARYGEEQGYWDFDGEEEAA
ncbi:hypothetical protein [Pontibacter arcticus]|uniref:Uncharacterized protein n=1 Tax=Pontibacter arcticus TaxID=2080288 RepID=A0A364RF08_9BACT|nr:hypothetical protein [Pontibacter arcticus]RAU82938.1 hypothetical protein DP923_06755 [Pontibacter arcticus]